MSRLSRLAQLAARVTEDPQPHVPSPCMSICVMSPVTGWCEGCLRTLAEIGEWAHADDAAKRQVWHTIAQRIPTAESGA
jgi:predicted Fe-S protein YdhL (DUF1289 family)